MFHIAISILTGIFIGFGFRCIGFVLEELGKVAKVAMSVCSVVGAISYFLSNISFTIDITNVNALINYIGNLVTHSVIYFFVDGFLGVLCAIVAFMVTDIIMLIREYNMRFNYF